MENFQDTLELNTSNSSTSLGSPFAIENYLVSSAYIAIALISVFGNTLVLLAVLTNRRLRTTSNYLLAALAVPDFFQGAVSIPLRLVEVLVTDRDLRTFCRAAIPISTVFGGTSNLHILLIAIERFIAICWPFFYCSWVTRTKFAFGGVGITWLLVSMFSLFPVMGWGGKEPAGYITFCRFPVFLTQQYVTSLFIFVHVIPIIIVIFLNAFILKASFYHVRRIGVQVKAIRANSQAHRNSETSEQRPNTVDATKRKIHSLKQRKATQIVAIVVGFFILLVVPIITIDVVEMVAGSIVPLPLVKIAVLMIYTNHCVNVFVYAGYNSEYRKTFKRIIKRSMNAVKCRVAW